MIHKKKSVRCYSSIEEISLRQKDFKSLPLLQTGSGLKLFTYLFTAGWILFCLSLIYVPWVQTVEGRGKVIALAANERQQDIQTPVDGRVNHWHVSEGSKVKKGDPLVDVLDLDPFILDRLSQERSAASEKLTALESAKDASYTNLTRQQKLAREGLSSQRAIELAQIEFNKLMSDVATAASELARIDGRISRQAAQTVLAPRDGTVTRIIVPQGDGATVKSGTVLAKLVPDTNEVSVELKINGLDIPLISEGRLVRLQFEGWPAVQFSGWPNVAVGVFNGLVKVIDASDDGTGSFRILVTPEKPGSWPSFPYLRQGVRAHGWILLDPVSVGWELWRKLNGFPPAIGGVSESIKTAENKIP